MAPVRWTAEMHEKLLSAILHHDATFATALHAEYPAIATELGCSVSALRQHMEAFKRRPVSLSGETPQGVEKRTSRTGAKKANGKKDAGKGSSGNESEEAGENVVAKGVKKEESGAGDEDGDGDADVKLPGSKKRKMAHFE